MKRIFLFTVMAMVLIQFPVHSQLITGTHTVGTGVNQMDLTVTVNSALNQVKFEMTGPAGVWFGFAFNTTTMTPGSYTILANVSGGNPAEYLMNLHSAPTLQPVQNLTGITSSTSGGRKSYTFYRAISTGDPNDYVFSTSVGQLDIAWAYGTSLALGYHANRDDFSLSFVNPCASIQPTLLPPVQICDGDSVLIFGQYRTTAGTYSQSFSIPWSCDSVVSQDLIVNQPVTFTLPAIHICPGDSALIFGQYQHTAGNYSLTLTTQHQCDSTVVQPLIVSQGGTIRDTIGVWLCEGDSVLIGTSWVNQPGEHQVITLAGCDSLIYLYIVMHVILDTNVTVIGQSLNATPGYTSYQWIDCSTGLTAPGSINSSIYSPMVLGTYRVEITHNGCTAISECHLAGPTSVERLEERSVQLDVFPNPARNILNVIIPDEITGGTFLLYDLAGKVLFAKEFSQPGNLEADLTGVAPGSYLAVVAGNGITLRTRVVVTH